MSIKVEGSVSTILRPEFADWPFEASMGIKTGSEYTLDEELCFVHTREEASKHANMLLFYHRSAGAEYSFRARCDIPLGQVVRLHKHSSLGVARGSAFTNRQEKRRKNI